MGIVSAIIIGFVIGLLARFLKPGRDSMGIIFTTLLGIAGAVVGGYLGRVFGIYGPDEPAGFLASILGSILLLVLVQGIRGRRSA